MDVVIPLHPKDSVKLPYCIQGLEHYVRGLRTIYVISAEDPECEECTWIPESAFPFSVEDIRAITGPTRNCREGWYFQQLCKLYLFRVIPDLSEKVLAIDADIIVCRPVEFLDASGVSLLDWRTQDYLEYYRHASRLFKGEFQIYDIAKSGIRDYMIFQRNIVDALLAKIEAVSGIPAWKAAMAAVDPAYYEGSGMSEFELYFNFALTRFPNAVRLRQLVHYEGKDFADLGQPDTDIVSLHSWKSAIRDAERDRPSIQEAVMLRQEETLRIEAEKALLASKLQELHALQNRYLMG